MPSHSSSRTVIIWRINGNPTTEHCVSTSRVPCADISLSICISRLGEGSKIRIQFFFARVFSSTLQSKNLKIKIYRTTILPVVLYGCETWSLTLREERRLRVFENRVLRRIFGPKRDTVTGEWRKSHNEELNNLYSSANIVWVIKSRRMRWAGHVARKREGRGVYRVLVGRRPLGRPRRRWEDNIRMDLREVGCGCVDWMELAQDRDRWRALVSAVMDLRVP